MQWYTNESGYICLGKQGQFAEFHIQTSQRLEKHISQPLSQNDLEEIGSYPEDWPYDGSIQEKVESLARRFQ